MSQIREKLKSILDRFAPAGYQSDLLEHLNTYVEGVTSDTTLQQVKTLTIDDNTILVMKTAEPMEVEYVSRIRDAIARNTGKKRIVVVFMGLDEDLSTLTEKERLKFMEILGVADALGAAQNELQTLNGLVATDRPDAKLGKFSFRVNVGDTLAKIAKVMPEPAPKPEENPS